MAAPRGGRHQDLRPRPMHDATLTYIIDDTRILLALKKRGFGKDRWNGCGGKPKQGESLEAAACREQHEETGVTVDPADLEKVAEFDFSFPHVPQEKDWDQRVHVFFIRRWIGEPLESEEMRPQWFLRARLLDAKNPAYATMWPDDQYWLPLVLSGKKVRGSFTFAEDGSVQEKQVEVIDRFG